MVIIMFGKKKETKLLPIEDIKTMERRGMSDKDIIKELKHKGFSYKDIEKAMLEAVKDGVGDNPAARSGFEAFTPPEDYYSPPAAAQSLQMPTFEEQFPQELEGEQSDVVIEELIEGIVEEKWQQFEERMTKIEESLEHINAQLKQYEVRLMQPQNAPSKELEIKMNDISDHLDDMDARVGGLEKAFKQFLPSLTRNIEALSHMIHEIKEKGGHVEIEEEV